MASFTMPNLLVILMFIVSGVVSNTIKSDVPAVERRMLLVPPGDSTDNKLTNSNDNPEARLNNEDILTPQQLLATLHQIRQKQNAAPQRPATLSAKRQKSSNEMPEVTPTDYSQQSNLNKPAIVMQQQKPQGLSTTWKFLLQVIKDITSNLGHPVSRTNVQQKVTSKEEIVPPTENRENNNNNNNGVFEEERETVTKLVGAILGRFDCRKHAICKAGKYMGTFRGKNIVLLFLEKWAPDSWTETLRVAKSAAIYGDSCEKFYCPIPE